MFSNVINNSLIITAFVLSMMLLIEFINVLTRGIYGIRLSNSRRSQILLAVFLGLLPGCMGTYTLVSLFTHKIVGLGALVAGFIATSGDEAFVMLGLIPDTFLIISAVLIGVALLFGYSVEHISPAQFKSNSEEIKLTIHDEEPEHVFSGKEFLSQLKNISFQRAILIFGTLFLLFGLLSGKFHHEHGIDLSMHAQEQTSGHVHGVESADHDHSHQSTTIEHEHDEGHFDWLSITLMISLGLSLVIILIVSDHFLDEHFWDHIIKKHFLKVFLWTFGALLLIHVLLDHVQIEQWLSNNLYLVLVIAVLVGIIPESGPHLVFLSLFLTGTIPLSILLANSIVQDGHGALPLLAESKRAFLLAKLINAIAGFLIGLAGIWLGF